MALLSFRLGGVDGVSVAAAGWARCLVELGLRVVTVAGSGPVDRLVPGLAWPTPSATSRPSAKAVAGAGGQGLGDAPADGPAEALDGGPNPSLAEARADDLAGALGDALADVDLVVVENLCSLPLNPAATAVVASFLRGRPAVLHHYDLPWQRARFAHRANGWPPQDPAWRHVVCNDLSRRQLSERGITAVVIPPAFDVDEPAGDRMSTRAHLGLGDDERVVLHPVRAIERKAVPAAIALAEALEATYWLTGPAEEDYQATLDRLLDRARCPVLHRPAPPSAIGTGMGMAGAYAAADVVAFPSTWEGFGNPLVETAIHRRPLALNRYPVAEEIASLGFGWFDLDDQGSIARFLARPDQALHDRNARLARRHFSLARVGADLARLLEELPWT